LKFGISFDIVLLREDEEYGCGYFQNWIR